MSSVMQRVGPIVALAVVSAGCLKPPLILEHKGHAIEVSMAKLGEYPSSVSRIQLKDMRRKAIVWELKAKGRVPQIWRFYLHPGMNPSELSGGSSGEYEVVVPRKAESFKLYVGRRYEISVWNKEGSRRERADFTL